MGCEKNLLVGYGQKDMTPPMGHPLAGRYQPRYVSEVINPLYVRAILFDNGQRKGLIITIEVCFIHQENCSMIREKIASELGMDADAILINASHTHTGPVVGNDITSDIEADPAYTEHLICQCICAAVEASQNMTPARLFYAETEAKGLSFVRRYMLKDGTVKTNPGKVLDMIDHPIGTPDDTLRLLKIVRNGADDIYLFNFNTHADTVGRDRICSDWPGFASSILEASIPGSKAVFVLGPQGDVNHINYLDRNNKGIVNPVWDENAEEFHITHSRHMGRVVAGKVLTICDKAEEINGTDISFASKKVDLMVNRPDVGEEMRRDAWELLNTYYEWFRNPGDRKCPTTVDKVLAAERALRLQTAPEFETYSVHGLKIGDFVIATMPGEIFTDLGRQVRNGVDYKKMMVLCNTNGYCGYIPTKDCFDDGGYEANSSKYLGDSPDRLVNGTVAAVKEL